MNFMSFPINGNPLKSQADLASTQSLYTSTTHLGDLQFIKNVQINSSINQIQNVTTKYNTDH